MARILVSYYKMQEVEIQTMMYYFEGFAKELQAQGNDVFLINTAYFNSYGSNVVLSSHLDMLLLEAVKKFDPELIVAFNNRAPKTILDSFDVPIIMWDGDSPEYLCDVNYMLENRERYRIFSISKKWCSEYRDYGFSKDAIFYFPNATSVRAEQLEQTMNVSFLGTRLWTNGFVPSKLAEHEYLTKSKNVVEESLRTGNKDSDYFLQKYFRGEKELYNLSSEKLYPLLEYRWLVLANMLDLGLTISGHYTRWEDVARYMPQLTACCDFKQVWSLSENNSFYNRSKVSLCPLHPQTKGSTFAWRAFDVMASNACLLMEESSEFRQLTDGQVNVPFFRSPYEARELCKQLLSDDVMRREIVEASQAFVEKNARWPQRFQDAQEILDIPLVDVKKEGAICEQLLEVPEIIGYLHSKEKKEDNSPNKRERVKKVWWKLQDTETILRVIKDGLIAVFFGVLFPCLLECSSPAPIYRVLMPFRGFFTIASAILRWVGVVAICCSLAIFFVKVLIKLKKHFRSQ